MQLLITQFFIFTCIWHVVMSPPLFLQCGVEWHLHRHHFCVVHMTSPPFICSVHTGLSFLLATLPRFANVFLCSSSSRELFLSSCQCYTIFLCTKTVSDLDFYHFLPSTGFGFFSKHHFWCLDDALVVSCVGVFSLTGCKVIFVGILLLLLWCQLPLSLWEQPLYEPAGLGYMAGGFCLCSPLSIFWFLLWGCK